ncbi:MAG: hypothetical protein PF961_20755 [Planctomycetota bacterium]|nr:hypothetical protein [Planctomycetota bacterium]
MRIGVLQAGSVVGLFATGLVVSCLGAAETSETTDAPLVMGGQHLLDSDRVPAAFVGEWLRLSDGTQLHLVADQSMSGLQAGSYQTPHGQVQIRHGDDAANRALSLVGAAVITEAQLPDRFALAESVTAFDHLTVVIASWRLVDDFAWPWVEYQGDDGLAWICQRRNPTAKGFAFDADQGCYVDAEGRAIGLGHGTGLGDGLVAQLGDVVAVAPLDAEFPTVALLVADNGRRGVLDPDDLVVSAQANEAGGALHDQVRAVSLGLLMGPYDVHVFARDRQRAEAMLAKRSATPPFRPDNPIWDLPRWRQLCALAGMVILTLVLLRRARRYRRGKG